MQLQNRKLVFGSEGTFLLRLGQVDSVDIKRLPDGTSRGFAFVKFTDKDTHVPEKGQCCGWALGLTCCNASQALMSYWCSIPCQESVDKAVEAKANHMIDNKCPG